jgi:lipopolysaccharide/colanic/teichoic acid biosynthesis glycosyltransferase
MLACFFLVLLSPILLVVAIAIMIDSLGNPLYVAERAGRKRVPFRMFKFRTMVRNAARLGPAITGHNDWRITRIGRFLRRTKLDELPQLVNVVAGEMSLVGPRPEVLEIVALYTPEQQQLLDVKPGITGRNQIAGDESELIPEGLVADRYYVEHLLEAKLRVDLEYLRSRSLLSDMSILFMTGRLILRSLARL